VACGPRKKPLDFGGNPDHGILPCGVYVSPGICLTVEVCALLSAVLVISALLTNLGSFC